MMLLGYTFSVFTAGVFISHAYAPELHGSNPPPIIDSLPNLGQPNTAYETVFIGAVLIRTYRADDREIQQVELSLSDAKETGTGKSAEATLAAEKRRATVTLALYLSHLRQSAEHYTENQLNQALINLSLAFTAEEDLLPFVSFTRLFVSHVVTFRRTGVIDKQQILRDLVRS